MLDLAQLDLVTLSPTQRVMLAQALLDSVVYEAAPAELSAPQLDELRTRAEDVRSGRLRGDSWEVVLQRLRSR